MRVLFALIFDEAEGVTDFEWREPYVAIRPPELFGQA
jgi:hypothetical protein